LSTLVFSIGSDHLSPWLLTSTVIFNSAIKDTTGQLYVSIPELKFSKTLKITLKGTPKERVNIGSFVFAADVIEPWWPRGYGKQTLYNVDVSSIYLST